MIEVNKTKRVMFANNKFYKKAIYGAEEITSENVTTKRLIVVISFILQSVCFYITPPRVFRLIITDVQRGRFLLRSLKQEECERINHLHLFEF